MKIDDGRMEFVMSRCNVRIVLFIVVVVRGNFVVAGMIANHCPFSPAVRGPVDASFRRKPTVAVIREPVVLHGIRIRHFRYPFENPRVSPETLQSECATATGERVRASAPAVHD